MVKRFKVLRHSIKIIIPVAINILLEFIAFGQNEPFPTTDKSSGTSPYSIRQISVSDGLPSNVITGIVKDYAGYMWIATPAGLCRWDGFSASVYKHFESDSNTIISDAIPRSGLIWEPSNRRLVIGTKEGISFFDPANKIFINYPINPIKSNSLPSAVNVVFIDRQGILWVGTDKGFSMFKPESKDFKNYTCNQNFPAGLVLERNSTNLIHDIKQDFQNDSILWLASLAGLLKFDKFTEELSWFYFPDKDYLREINQFTLLTPHPDGKIYLGTWNYDMAVFDTRRELFTGRFGTASSGVNQLQNRVLPYGTKSDSELWVSSLQGLGILNTQTGHINFIQTFKNENGHRFAPELFYLDDGQNFWLGSEYGVLVLKTKSYQISNYFFEPLDEDHWYLTSCIFEDTLRNELLVGYGRGEGLHIFNLDSKQFRIIQYSPRSINEFNLVAIVQSGIGEIFTLTADEIYQYKPEINKLVPLNYPYNNFPAFTNMKLDKDGNLWVTSGNHGLQKFNLQDHSVKNIRDWGSYFETGHELPLFAEICIDPENRIWFRRRGESYGYYDPGKDTVRYFKDAENAFDLTCFSEPIHDTIWVATAKNGLGFIEVNNADRGVQPVYFAESLKNTIIGDIEIDGKARIWGLTEKGLIRIDRNGKYVLFDENYGVNVHDSWSNKNALLPGELKLLSNGTMVIGYRRGLGFFNPDSLKEPFKTPEPYFNSFKVLDKGISLQPNKILRLNYYENHISFSYSALDLYNGGIVLRHKLSGVDNDWVENLPQQEVTYANLLPGKYKFTVGTLSKSGFGGKKELSLEFQILPPWWKTFWAYAIFLLLIFLLLYIFYQYQLKRQLAVREARRLRELDDMKTRLYANITHEFRTPITVIMGLAEELSDLTSAGEKQIFRKKLETIQRNGGNLLHLVNQMLDLAKLEHGKLNYLPIQSDIIPWLQYIVESHHSLAAAKDIQLTFYPETESLEMDYDPDQLSKVISNLLTNAIKFTEKRGKVICHTKFESTENTLHIKVKDTGVGIPETEHLKIFDRFYQVESIQKQNSGGTGIGLSLTKEIVERIGGTISVKSQPGKGSEFEVVLTVTHNAPQTPDKGVKFEKPLVQYTINSDDPEEDMQDLNGVIEKPLVLIAEDNPDVAGFIRDTIRRQYKIKWASDGEKALQMAFELIPDLVITDVMMPGKDGFEVCNIIKMDERTDHIPVIMLTAKVTDNDRITGYKHGADAYLTKPFNKKELLVRLEQLLKLRKQLQDKFSKLVLKAESIKPQSPEEQFITKAAQIVETNLEKSMFNAADLASEIHLSESQLYRKLKAISGKSTAIFIRTVRLKKARELLETSNLSISEIAYQVGFNDPAWFSRVFKEEFGVSPTEARGK